MALFRGIQENIALDVNNITLVFDSGNIVNISGNLFLYPPQGHPILYKNPMTLPIAIFYVRMRTIKLNVLVRSLVCIYAGYLKFVTKNDLQTRNCCTQIFDVRIRVVCPIRFQRLRLYILSDSVCLYQCNFYCDVILHIHM